MGEITTKDWKPRCMRRAANERTPTLALWKDQAKEPGCTWVQAQPCFLCSFQKLDWAGELLSAWLYPMAPLVQSFFPGLGTSYLWFLAYIFRLSECERLVSMRFGFFSESPGPLTFKIVLSPYLHFDIIHALFPLHPVCSVPPGFSPRQTLSYLTLQSS